MSATIGEWTPLPGGTGTLLSIAGDLTAAAGLARLTVWSGDRVAAAVEAERPVPGRAVLGEHEAWWGGAVLDLGGGEARFLDNIGAALGVGLDLPVMPAPGSGYRTTASAWSADGEALVVSGAWAGPPGPPEARAVLLDGSGAPRTLLWEGSDLAPAAVWVGPSLILVGTREPRVYARDGSLFTVLDGGAPAARIDGDARERWLLVTEHGRITLWRTAVWEPVAHWEGRWLDAALTPDTALVVAVDLEGRLHAGGGEAGALELLEAPDPVQAIAVSEDRIVASFARGVPVRSAPLRRGGVASG